MLYTITKQTINNGNIIKTFDPIVVECTNAELDLIIKPKLEILQYVNNKHYAIIGSDSKCIYEVIPFKVLTVKEITDRFENDILDGIDKYNHFVNIRNLDIKHCNKKNDRPLELGLLTELDKREILKTLREKEIIKE